MKRIVYWSTGVVFLVIGFLVGQSVLAASDNPRVSQRRAQARAEIPTLGEDLIAQFFRYLSGINLEGAIDMEWNDSDGDGVSKVRINDLQTRAQFRLSEDIVIPQDIGKDEMARKVEPKIIFGSKDLLFDISINTIKGANGVSTGSGVGKLLMYRLVRDSSGRITGKTPASLLLSIRSEQLNILSASLNSVDIQMRGLDTKSDTLTLDATCNLTQNKVGLDGVVSQERAKTCRITFVHDQRKGGNVLRLRIDSLNEN